MIAYFDVSQTAQALMTLGIVVLMLVLFVRETYPAEVVALTGTAVLLALGLLPYDVALGVLSNPAPWTIAMMFLLVGALVRTGALQAFTSLASRRARTHPKLAVATTVALVVLSSAVLNNTPVVVVMIPVFVQLAHTLKISASRLLIPLSYAAILGGMLTLIGTSTNLLVDGVARAGGLKPFGMFEVTPLAAVLVVWGMIYLRFVGPRLLPHRDSLADMLSDRSRMKFFTEAVIPPDSNLIGREVNGVQLFKREGVRLIDVVRGNRSLRREFAEVTLEVGDIVVLRTQMSELLSLQNNKSLRRVDQLSAVETTTVEVLITPGCRMIGRRLGSLGLRRRYGVYPLAAHRRNQNIGHQLDTLIVRVGDTLLLEGAPEDIKRLASDMDMVDVSQPSERAYRRSHAPIAVIALIAMVVLAGFGVAPILALSVIAVAVVLISRCIDADEAFSFVEGRLLALVFAMLAIGAALEESGAVALIVSSAAPWLMHMPGVVVIWAVYLMTSILTETSKHKS